MCGYFCSYYDDFVTIDWVRDRSRDRVRHKRLEVNRELNWSGWAAKVWDAMSGWLIVFLVGVSSGLLAGERQRMGRGLREGARARLRGEGRGERHKDGMEYVS